MIPRAVFTVLFAGLVLSMVAFAVVMAFQLLLAALGDETAAGVLRAVGVGCLILLMADLVLLVAALGVNASMERRD